MGSGVGVQDSHRVPRSQWASPFVQGHTCTTDDWLPLYVDFVLANLQAELPALQGKRLACDCGPDGVCEADALAGMVFDATHPDAEASLPRVTGRQDLCALAAIMGSLRGKDFQQGCRGGLLQMRQNGCLYPTRGGMEALWLWAPCCLPSASRWRLRLALDEEGGPKGPSHSIVPDSTGPPTWATEKIGTTQPDRACERPKSHPPEETRVTSTGVTSKRDLGLLGLFVVLMWGDFALPHGFIKGLPAVGYAPHYRVFPHQPVKAIAHLEVLAGWEEHNAATIAGVRPGSTDSFVLEQSTQDHKEGFCTPPMNLSQLKRYAKGDPYRLIPRCVITQASGKQRLIDDAARGGQSASSRDANKLVLCTPLRPALHCSLPSGVHLGAVRAAGAVDGGRRRLAECLPPLSYVTTGGPGLCGSLVPPGMAGARFQVYHALLFGLPLAVTSFNRYSRMAEAFWQSWCPCISMTVTSPTAQSTAHQPSGALAMTCWAPCLPSRSARELRMSVPSWVLTSTSRRSTHMGVRVFGFESDSSRRCSPSPGHEAAKLYGMVNFLEHGLFQALKNHQYGGSSRAGASLLSAYQYAPQEGADGPTHGRAEGGGCLGRGLGGTPSRVRRIPLGLPGRWRADPGSLCGRHPLAGL